MTQPTIPFDDDGVLPRDEHRHYALILDRLEPWTADDEALIRDAAVMAHEGGHRVMTWLLVGYSALLVLVGVVLGVVLMHWLG
jgi:hypothetical protein